MDSPLPGSPVVVEDEVDLIHGDLGNGRVLSPGGGATDPDAACAHPGAGDQGEAALGSTTGSQFTKRRHLTSIGEIMPLVN